MQKLKINIGKNVDLHPQDQILATPLALIMFCSVLYTFVICDTLDDGTIRYLLRHDFHPDVKLRDWWHHFKDAVHERPQTFSQERAKIFQGGGGQEPTFCSKTNKKDTIFF
jgi:hypothetical protein